MELTDDEKEFFKIMYPLDYKEKIERLESIQTKTLDYTIFSV